MALLVRKADREGTFRYYYQGRRVSRAWAVALLGDHFWEHADGGWNIGPRVDAPSLMDTQDLA